MVVHNVTEDMVKKDTANRLEGHFQGGLIADRIKAE